MPSDIDCYTEFSIKYLNIDYYSEAERASNLMKQERREILPKLISLYRVLLNIMHEIMCFLPSMVEPSLFSMDLDQPTMVISIYVRKTM
jgi:hypothetical protein